MEASQPKDCLATLNKHLDSFPQPFCTGSSQDSLMPLSSATRELPFWSHCLRWHAGVVIWQVTHSIPHSQFATEVWLGGIWIRYWNDYCWASAVSTLTKVDWNTQHSLDELKVCWTGYCFNNIVSFSLNIIMSRFNTDWTMAKRQQWVPGQDCAMCGEAVLLHWSCHKDTASEAGLKCSYCNAGTGHATYACIASMRIILTTQCDMMCCAVMCCDVMCECT